jgi:hypothetical protein
VEVLTELDLVVVGTETDFVIGKDYLLTGDADLGEAITAVPIF